MRPIKVRVSAIGPSVWIPANYLQLAFAMGLFFAPSSGAALTCTVQHTADDLSDDNAHPISISRSTTVATVTDPNHGLSVGDSAIIINSGSSVLDGAHDVVSVADANTYTYTCANSGATVSNAVTQGKNLRVFPHSTMVAMSTRQDGNYAFSVRAIRLQCTAYTSGFADFMVLQGMGH